MHLLPIATEIVAKFGYISIFGFTGAHNERVKEENWSNQFTKKHFPLGDKGRNETYSSQIKFLW